MPGTRNWNSSDFHVRHGPTGRRRFGPALASDVSKRSKHPTLGMRPRGRDETSRSSTGRRSGGGAPMRFRVTAVGRPRFGPLRVRQRPDECGRRRRWPTRTLRGRERPGAVVGAPAPFGMNHPRRTVGEDDDRRGGSEPGGILFEPPYPTPSCRGGSPIRGFRRRTSIARTRKRAIVSPPLPRAEGKKNGRPRSDDGKVPNGIVFVLRSGVPWRDPPTGSSTESASSSSGSLVNRSTAAVWPPAARNSPQTASQPFFSPRTASGCGSNP